MTAIELVETAWSALPVVPDEVIGVLHVVAFVGVVYLFHLGGLRFQGGGVELFGRRAASWEVPVGLAVVAVAVATAQWWVGVVFFLSGWQAFGLVCLEAGWLVQSTADGIDPAALATAAAGLALLFVPLVV